MRVPRTTYRIQFGPRFGFADARGIVAYLDDLGVSDLYASPLMEARPESAHGYDVINPADFSTALGGDAGFVQMTDALRERGLGLLVDIVPNHMATHALNPWWWDVLLRGRASEYAEWFDIDWERGGGKIVLPVLGSGIDEALAREEIKLTCTDHGREFRYFEHRFPVAEGTETGTIPAVLARQRYRLAWWKDGPREVNYRRFFDISELVGMRPEREDVFDAQHERVLNEVRAGRFTGLRVDHIDGLRRPGKYLNRLAGAAGDDTYLVVEKILGEGEALLRDWPVAGTTGYDVLNALNALFVDPQGHGAIVEHAAQTLGIAREFADEIYACKREVIDRSFPGDLESLAACAASALNRAAFDTGVLREAIASLTAGMPVYRTYFGCGASSELDRQVLALAAAEATRRAQRPDHLDPCRAIDAVRSLIESGGEFASRWQQFTGPVMAKGVEDTAMYRHIALVSLNEVGGNPRPCQDAVREWHEMIARGATTHPHRMSATTTHDTKRSEHVRARINALSEIAEEWTAILDRWRQWNNAKGRSVDGEPAPSARDESLLYQTLLGAWPLESDAAFVERMQAYMLKAGREAKLQTSWTDPNAAYEHAVREFVSAVIQENGTSFAEDFARLQRVTARLGALNALSQAAIKFAAPGVPDVYQGTEMWDLSLVDPDNRRPVDYQHRRVALQAIRVGWQLDAARLLDELLATWRSGRILLFLTWRFLQIRRAYEALFTHGEYTPLAASGTHSHRIIAFERSHGNQSAVLVAARLMRPLSREDDTLGIVAAHWEDTSIQLPPGAWRHALQANGAPLEGAARLSEVLTRMPAALLIRGA